MQYNNSTTYHSKMNENRLSLNRNCNPPGFNIPILNQKISSFKCKFINELQNHLEKHYPIPPHLQCLIVLIDQDRIKSKRSIPIFALRGHKQIQSENSWLKETTFTYNNLPFLEKYQNKKNQICTIYNKHGRINKKYNHEIKIVKKSILKYKFNIKTRQQKYHQNSSSQKKLNTISILPIGKIPTTSNQTAKKTTSNVVGIDR
jgi:hypothetical protein